MAAPGLLLALACCCTLLWLVWRVLHHYRLPRLPEQKLTRELIQHTLLESTSPLVRLPAAHGVLVTDPRLARKLLEGGHGAVRDVSEYARYRGFLDQSLVLLPQATTAHTTVCHTELKPQPSRAPGRSATHTLEPRLEQLRAALLPLFSVARGAHHAALVNPNPSPEPNP